MIASVCRSDHLATLTYVSCLEYSWPKQTKISQRSLISHLLMLPALKTEWQDNWFMIKKRRNFTQAPFPFCYQLILHSLSHALVCFLGICICGLQLLDQTSITVGEIARREAQASAWTQARNFDVKYWWLISVSSFLHWKMKIITIPIFSSQVED